MRTVIRTSHGMQELSLEGMLSAKRAICLSGPIDDAMAAAFSQQIMCLALDNRQRKIKLFITSDGGSIDAGMVIYDILQSSQPPIEINCIGKAYSMAAILLACGRHGRYLLPHSRVMVHEPLIPTTVGGRASSIQILSESMLRARKDLEDILARHTGQDRLALAEAIRGEKFFSAKEAVEFGLADGIRSFSQMIEEE